MLKQSQISSFVMQKSLARQIISEGAECTADSFNLLAKLGK